MLISESGVKITKHNTAGNRPCVRSRETRLSSVLSGAFRQPASADGRGLFIRVFPNLINNRSMNNESKPDIHNQQHAAGGRPGHGRLFGFPGQRLKRTRHAEEENVPDCRCFRFLPGLNAYDRMGLCPHHHPLFSPF